MKAWISTLTAQKCNEPIVLQPVYSSLTSEEQREMCPNFTGCC